MIVWKRVMNLIITIGLSDHMSDCRDLTTESFFCSISRYVVDYRVMTTSMSRIITQDRRNLDEDFADTLTILITTIKKNKQIERRM